MSIRRSSIVLLVVGLALIVAAGVIRFVALPSLTKLPADLSQGQKYEGTMSALNPQAFAANDLANLITPEMPITADRSLTVDATDGDTAIVTSNTAITLPDGSTQKDVHSYAVSRVDYAPVPLTDEQKQTLIPAADKATFEDHEGIAFSFPMGPAEDGNVLYDAVTRSGQAATYVDSGTLEGREVNNYEVNASGPIESPTVLAQFKDFPSQLPKAVVAGLLQAGIVPDASRATLQADLATLPDVLDLGFGSTNVAKLAVDKQFGAPLNVDQTQSMYVTVPVNGEDVPVLPLSTVKLHTAPSEVAGLAGKLSKNGVLLAIAGVWVPLGLVVVGLLFAAIAAARWRKPASVTPERRAEAAHV
ncbi:porin PorA family protein [Rhodococcus koreensis]|uniref:porin PorA family protein n=1 Tax=Rhodococcus koreensis TaxID=99653 RepID=UPI0036D8EDD6